MRLVSTSEAWPDAALIAPFTIEDDLAVEDPRSTVYRAQSRGPPYGPAVVTVRVTELFDIELGIKKNHYPRSKEVTIYALDY